MSKKILVLGAGLVARPLVHYLLEKTDREVIVASRTVSKAQDLVQGFSKGFAKPLDVSNNSSLQELIKDCDIAISLVPYTHHVSIAKICIAQKKHLITTSYVSDAMKALHNEAQEAGVLILNEIGLDPGIDHMSAMRVIHHVEKNGGYISSFKSYCGGLPAPEANNNPMGYKFSWSPRGVLMAGRNPAKYLENNKTIDIPGAELFMHHWPLTVPNHGTFEAYPNRNSLPYIELYGLQKARTMFRGTLRYPGWCSFWYNMTQLGWLQETPSKNLTEPTWAGLFRSLVPGNGSLSDDLCKHWNITPNSDEIKRLTWLGLFDEKPLPIGADNLLDILCAHLIKKLEYQPQERDMIVLYHEFEGTYPNRKERITSTLVDFGIPGGASAMSRTVSLPAAIATRFIIEGKFKNLKGVRIPVHSEIYNPILDELEALQIKCDENFEKEFTN